MNNLFLKARRIYAKNFVNEMNVSLFFVFDVVVINHAKLYVTGCSDYHIYDNGKFIAFGPARAAKGYYRIDNYSLKSGDHHVVIELSGYNAYSYYYQKDVPFIQYEVIEDGKTIEYSSKESKCYLNDTRIQKVPRYSFQRTFSEIYFMRFNPKLFFSGKDCFFFNVDLVEFDDCKYLPRGVKYPKYSKIKFELIEKGIYYPNKDLKPYDNRYLNLEFLGIFNKYDLYCNPSNFVSILEYKKDEVSEKNVYYTYKLPNVKTGFVSFDITCNRNNVIYFIFDEIDSQNKDYVNINFARNETHNIVKYELKKGRYKHMFFEPYCLKYLKLLVENNDIIINKLEFITYENNIINNIKFRDDKIQTVIDAAFESYIQNSVDLLSDCPGRERAGWLCDGYFTSLAERVFTGKNIVEKNFLQNYILFSGDKNLPKGMIPMCYPADFPDGNFIPNWSLWFILEIDKYYKLNKDLKILMRSKKIIKGLLNYFLKFENEFNLLENLEGWQFIEWSRANSKEFIEGVNIPTNMLYAKALEVGGDILNDDSLINKANNIKELIRKISFNGVFFVDNLIRNSKNELVPTKNISETCQYYAFFFGIANIKDHIDLFNLLVDKFGPSRDETKTYNQVAKSNMFIGNYLRLLILLENGKFEKILEESIDYFYKMASITGTLWEYDSTLASLNHGFTSSIAYVLIRVFLGLVNIDLDKKIIYLDHNHLSTNCSYRLKDIEIISNDGKIIINKPADYKIIEYKSYKLV